MAFEISVMNIYSSLSRLNHKIFRELRKVVKVVVLAEIPPRDFFQTLGNHY